MTRRFSPWLPGLCLIAAALCVYWPALRGSWVWDDQAEVAGNALLREPGALFKIWFAPPTADYFPLKTTLQWVGWRLWGLHVLGWHLLNLGLHLFSAFWFWRILRKLGVRLAWIGGLLFAIHPVAVESVAWIAELKNTLSMALLLVSADLWVERVAPNALGLRPSSGPNSNSNRRVGDNPPRRPSSGPNSDSPQRVGGQALGLLFFAAALLAKSSVVMFPVALLLHAWWAEGRVTRAVMLKAIPYFALSLALGLVTLWFQLHRAIQDEPISLGGPASRIAAAGLSTAFYLGKAIVPLKMASIYPRWRLVPPAALEFLPWLGFLAALALWWLRRASSAGRALAFGLGWFVLNLLPVMGFVPMSYLRFSWVADHFAYLSLLGPLALAAAASGRIADWARARARVWRIALQLAGGAVVVLLMLASFARAGVFRSDAIFWASAQRDNPRSWLPYSNLGLIDLALGRPAEAAADLEQGLVIDSDHAELRNNYGKVLAALGKSAEALPQFAAALRLRPNFVDARINFANALGQGGHWTQAIDQYRQVLELQPNSAEVHCYLGFALAQHGDPKAAETELQAAIRLNPAYAEPHCRLGSLQANAGRIPAAIAEFQTALRIDPNYAEALANLGLALTLAHNPSAAIPPLRRATALRPEDAAAHAYLGFALASSGAAAAALPEYETAVRLNPGNPDIHYNYAAALQALGRGEEADLQLEAARAAEGRRRP